MNMKLVVNKCYGGFGVSTAAILWLRERNHAESLAQTIAGEQFSDGTICPDYGSWLGRDATRNDPLLVECVETLGEKANGELAELRVIEIPDGISWGIDEYDGIETVHEVHRSW
jgi:hypothetical protein